MKIILYKIYKVLPVWLRWIISYIISEKFIVGISAFVTKNKQILLLNNTYQYYWALPGGYLKRDESFKESIERELKEETGLTVSMERVLKIKNVPHKPVIDVLVLCNVIKGEIKVDGKEVKEARFFDLDKLPLEDMPKFQIDYIDLFRKDTFK